MNATIRQVTGERPRAQRAAVLGTGSIGTAIARVLLRGGLDVSVWNRSAERTARAVEAGATAHPSAAEAAADAELVLMAVTDYAAVQSVLATLEPPRADATLAVLTTGTAEQALAAAERAASLGFAALDAGVQTAPENVGTSSATFLFGGDEHAYDRHRPVLELLGRPRFVGASHASAAVWDIALFGVWYDAQLGLLRALDVVRAAGIDPSGFAETASTQLGHVVESAVATTQELVQGEYPRGPADLQEHLPVLEQLAELHRSRPLGDGGAGEVAQRVKALIDAGHGGDGLTGLLRDIDRRAEPT